jgi:serine/threonine protein kinase
MASDERKGVAQGVRASNSGGQTAASAVASSPPATPKKVPSAHSTAKATPRSSKVEGNSNRSSSSAAAAPNAAAAAVPARQPWEVDYSEIVISGNPIGEGYFGQVFKARWRELTVCAKKLKNVRAGEASNFAKEVQVCSTIRHPHLVQFLAACTTKGHLCILTEWLSGGSLYSFLHEGKRVNGVRYRRSDFLVLLRIASEVARAMLYLHASRIVHRDLTTSNILLDANLTAKVGDFGLSRPTAPDGSTSGMGGGNLLYLSPEAFLLGKFTEASDVFAFGVVLNEMLSGAVPYSGISPALAASECANRGSRPAIASTAPVGIVRLI